jgi:Protein phosphatase 1 regulatory subunit 32
MTTETSERFQARSSHVDSSQKTIGSSEDTGFTHNHHVEPITYHPDYAYHGDSPVSAFNYVRVHCLP